MSERPRAGKLLSTGSAVVRESVAALVARVDDELRRIGEALTADLEGDHTAALVAAMDDLRRVADPRVADRILPAELDRRLGSGLVLLGAAYDRTGAKTDATIAYGRALRLLSPGGLEDLPADVLLPYATALLRYGDPQRAAAAVRQATRRGFGHRAAPLAEAVADKLAAVGQTTAAQGLLREFAEAAPMTAVEDDWRLVDALDRHGLTDLAVARCLALAVTFAPSEPNYLEAYLRAARLSNGDPSVAVRVAKELASVDVHAALDTLDAAIGGRGNPDVLVVRAEILALSGQVLDAAAVLDGPDAPPPGTAGLAAMRGLIAYLQDDYRTAVRHLRAALEVLEVDDDDPRSVVLLGDAAYRLAEPDPAALAVAERHLRRTLRLRGLDGTTLSVLSLVQRARGNAVGAQESLYEAAARDDAPSWVYSQVGEERRRGGRYEEAHALFDRAIERNPEDAWAIGSRGQANAALGATAGALTDYAVALRLDPSLGWVFESALEVAEAGSDTLMPVLGALVTAARDTGQDSSVRAQAARRAAHLLVAREDTAGALELLEQAGRYAPDAADVAVSRAVIRSEAGDVTAAGADLALAAEIDPDLAWAVQSPSTVSMAPTPLRDRMVERLLAYAADEAQPSGERAATLVEAARALDTTREPRLVGDLLERALALDAGDPFVHAEYGDALVFQGRAQDALAAFERAVELAPDNPELLAGLGWAQHRVDDLDGATQRLRRALELKPDYRWASIELAAVLVETSPAEARQIYRQLLRTDPADVAAARGLSAVDVAEGRTTEAMAALQRALRHNPGDDNLLSDVALLALRVEDVSHAVEVAQGLVRDKPDSVVGWLTVGMLHNQFGEWPQALTAFDQALALDATRSDLHGHRAWAREYSGDLHGAADALEQALRYDQDPYLLRERGLVLHALGDPRGVDLLTEMVTRSGGRRDAGTLAHEGFCLVALGRSKEGAKSLVQALDVDPTDVGTQLDLALALLAAGRTEAGQGEYRRAVARVVNRAPRRQVGLLRVALVDLGQVRRWFPEVAGYDRSASLLDDALSRAQSAVAAEEGEPADPIRGSGLATS